MFLSLLALAGCSRSQVLTALSLVVSTVERSLPALAAGAPPATITAAREYLRAVSRATAAASEILAGPLAPAEKSAAIAQAFAGIAGDCKCLGAGAPARVAGLLDLVVSSVGRFLSTVTPKTESLAGGIGAGVKPGELVELGSLRARSLAIVASIEGGL